MSHSIGSKIAELRKEKKMTQSELAEKMGVSPQAVSKWENDLAYPDITLLKQLADELDCSIDQLLSPDQQSETVYVAENKRKKVEDLTFKIRIQHDEEKVSINIPLILFKAFKNNDMNFFEVTGSSNSEALNNIDFQKLIALAEQGVLGKLLELESSDGAHIEIFVE